MENTLINQYGFDTKYNEDNEDATYAWDKAQRDVSNDSLSLESQH